MFKDDRLYSCEESCRFSKGLDDEISRLSTKKSSFGGLSIGKARWSDAIAYGQSQRRKEKY